MLILSRSKLPLPDFTRFTYTVRYITWQLLKIYIPFYEVCYDDCTDEEISREYIGKGETGKTEEVIVNMRDVTVSL